MPSLNNLYAQHLSAELPPQATDDPARYQELIGRVAELVRGADAVVCGIGSGMSTAAGYDFYHGGELFERELGRFGWAHGFHTLFDGMYHAWGRTEEQWAFTAAFIDLVRRLPVGRPYCDLAAALADKPHFVLTSNVDAQVPRAFGEERVCLFQGDLRYFQCSQPCHDAVFENEAQVRAMVEALGTDGLALPYELLPRCPECGWLMMPWVRDETFLEGSFWRAQVERYRDYLRTWLVEREGRVLFLELGVSSMTPAVIKLPFWDMVARNPQAFYVCVNQAEDSAPLQLGERALMLPADLARVTADLRVELGA